MMKHTTAGQKKGPRLHTFLSFFPLVQLYLTFHYSTSEPNWCFPKKKKKVWLWKHAESLQNAWTWVHLHVVSGPRTVQIPLFKAKLAEQVKKFAHPTTGSQQQPQVRCSLKLGRKKRLSVPLLCYSVLRRFWPDGLSNHIHPNHDMIRDTIPL